MSAGGLFFATAAMNAVSQIGQGYAQSAEAKANASILEAQAGFIDVKKGIEFRQYERMKAKAMGTSMANIAASGLMPSGSPMAVVLDTQTQINIDQAIGQFNLEQEKQYKLSEAESYRRKGKLARTAGYMGAFSSLLQGASSYMQYKGTFDSNMGGGGMSQYGNFYGSNTPYGVRDMGTFSTLPRR